MNMLPTIINLNKDTKEIISNLDNYDLAVFLYLCNEPIKDLYEYAREELLKRPKIEEIKFICPITQSHLTLKVNRGKTVEETTIKKEIDGDKVVDFAIQEGFILGKHKVETYDVDSEGNKINIETTEEGNHSLIEQEHGYLKNLDKFVKEVADHKIKKSYDRFTIKDEK